MKGPNRPIDLDVGLTEQVPGHQSHGLRSDSPAPVRLRQSVADADFVDLVPETVHLRQAAEVPVLSQENTQDQGFAQALAVQSLHNPVDIRILLFIQEGGKVPVHSLAVGQAVERVTVGLRQPAQGQPLALKCRNSLEESSDC